jgi:hypothetical protein
LPPAWLPFEPGDPAPGTPAGNSGVGVGGGVAPPSSGSGNGSIWGVGVGAGCDTVGARGGAASGRCFSDAATSTWPVTQTGVWSLFDE